MVERGFCTHERCQWLDHSDSGLPTSRVGLERAARVAYVSSEDLLVVIVSFASASQA